MNEECLDFVLGLSKDLVSRYTVRIARTVIKLYNHFLRQGYSSKEAEKLVLRVIEEASDKFLGGG